ncbi:sensor histidine kinase [Halohasta salina]|uniref:sensor histidine kinase n=1 Tax=Halohasta salina TaxID=2961621 RepID=UPI0020A46F82|nr:ATP-binding protein [Halohasta salina]
MEDRDRPLFVGPSALASQVGAALGREFAVAPTTAAASERLGERTACVVTDHDPPTHDCFELLESTDRPVVVVPTDGGTSALATRALQAGAATYLDPTTVDDVPAAVAAAVERAIADAEADVEARIEEFSSIVSHELRSPIQTAKSGIDLAKAQCDSRYLDEVGETIDRMDELIDNLLELLDTGETTVETTGVDLEAVVEAAWPGGTAANLLIEDELPTVEAERSRLQQLLENLFRNAVDHAGETVTVRVGVVGDPATGFYVADDGPGIVADRRELVFEYGYTDSEAGSGLGLAIVEEIAEAFGWTVTITDSETGGARFEISQVDIR